MIALHFEGLLSKQWQNFTLLRCSNQFSTAERKQKEKRTPVPCTTNLTEHSQAFLGKPGSTETQLVISSRVHDGRLGLI